MKFFGDEFLLWEDTKHKIDLMTIKELTYNGYTPLTPNESIYIMSSPNEILLELIKRIKQMKVLVSNPEKYQTVIAKSLGYKPEDIEKQLKPEPYDFIR